MTRQVWNLNQRGNGLKSIATFLVLTVALTLPFWFIAPSEDELPILILLTPGLAALITRFIYQRNVRDLGWKLVKTEAHPRWWHWSNSRYLALGYALPPLIAVVVYGAMWVVVSGSYATEDSASEVLVSFFVTATVLFLFLAVLGLSEEVGWRGFLLPELTKRFNFVSAAVITGLVWGAWHYPLIFFASQHFDFGELSLYFAVPMFTLILIPVSFFMGWLRLKTGSIWPAVVVHGSHNSLTLAFFNDLSSETGSAPYIAGEVGIGLLVVWTIVAVAIWRIWPLTPSES